MKRERLPTKSGGRPFWLPASTYYFLTLAVASVTFFVVWAVLAEQREENPWITAGLIASISMVAAVVVREVVIRNRRRTIFAAQRRLDRALLSAPVQVRRSDPEKFTLERNALLLSEIERKAEAARVLGNFSESHRAVFDLCSQYIAVATKELPKIGVGSPRLAAIKKGRDKAERLHHEHMLRWTAIEIQKNTSELEDANSRIRLKGARNALETVEAALQYYPDDPDLIATRSAIAKFSVSIGVDDLIKRSKRYEVRGEAVRALSSLIKARALIEEYPGLDGDKSQLRMVLDGIERLESGLIR